MPTVEQRIATLLSNLEAASKVIDPESPHYLLFLQVRELAEIVGRIVPVVTHLCPDKSDDV